MLRNNFFAVVMGLFLVAGLAQAATVEVPEEELAKESVLPRFERGEAVKNRNVVTNKKFELGAFGGWNFTEAIYNQMKFGFNAGYHISEGSAFVLNFNFFMPGRNKQYTDMLLSGFKLDFTRTPDVQFSTWLNWEMKAYYGKMSWTKSGVMNVHLCPILGVGIIKYAHKVYPGINFGLGQKFYFSNNFSLRADFKLQYAQGPNPFLGGGALLTEINGAPNNAIPSPSAFEDKFTLGTILDIGASFLF